jgi:polar amino acid transport system substrate-binding protein
MIRTHFRLVVHVLLCPVLLFSLFACVQASPSSTPAAPAASSKVLRVGITSNAPPLAYKEGRTTVGLEAEFAKGLAAATGRELRFVELKWKDQIPALLAGKTDIIMSGMTITDYRRYQIAFSTPYMVSGQVSLVRRPELSTYTDGFTDLLNPTVKVGTVLGTTGSFFIDEKIANSRKKFTFNTPQQAVEALLDRKIDAFVYDLPMNFHFAAQNEINGLAPVMIPMTREEIAWGIRKNDQQLIQEADAYLAAIKESGQLKTMLIHWIPFFKNVFDR